MVSRSGRIIGVRGGQWRATVDPQGTVVPHDGSAALQWHVAGDDRWYSPADEATVRQKWYAGYPVAETRMRVGNGDIVQRVYCVADLGGITVVEFENETPMSVAVALTRPDLLTTREVPGTQPQGIDLPAGSIAIPLGHKSTVRVGISHASAGRGRLPDDLPTHQQVVRGWESACDTASRIVMGDHAVVAGIARVRSDLLLAAGSAGPHEPGTAVELVRLGETHHDSIVDVVDDVHARLRSEKKSRTLRWDTPHLMATAARACVLLGDERAADDVVAAWARLGEIPVEAPPAVMPEGVSGVAWVESLMALGAPTGSSCALFPWGIPETWWGSPFEGHGLVAGIRHKVSFAVRWHGERPALLWEVAGPPGLVLTGGGADTAWSTSDASGEALLAAPVRVGV